MAGFLGLDELFEGDHFDRVASILCVRYLRFKLSFRDLVEMMTASAPGVMWRPPRRSSTRRTPGMPTADDHLDGYAASHRAVREMTADGSLPGDTELRSSSYLNNLIEQDHNLRSLRLKDRRAPVVWNAVLAA